MRWRLRPLELGLLLFPAVYAAGAAAILGAEWPWWAVVPGAALAASVALGVGLGRGDRVVLPIAAMLAAIGTVTVARLEPALLADPMVPGALLPRHLVSVATGFAVLAGVAVLVRPDWIRRYTYTWMALAVALLLAALVFGEEIRGARLWLRIGPVQVQPSEIMRLALVVWLAGYLDRRRELVGAAAGVGTAAALPYLAPIGVVGAASVAVLVLQNDLGTALLLFGVALAMLYAATGRGTYVALGAGTFAVAAWVAGSAVGRLAIRAQNWFDPWRDPLASGYQQVQSEYALAAGGLFGVGLGRGMPQAIPDVQTDFVLAAIGEEQGFVGVAVVLALLFLLVWRAVIVAMRAPDGFGRLLAVGLGAAFGVQALLIAGGVLRLLPLTGLTVPFVSYGGSAMVTNMAAAGLLLAVSRTSTGRTSARSP